jgi:hypothetical protein
MGQSLSLCNSWERLYVGEMKMGHAGFAKESYKMSSRIIRHIVLAFFVVTTTIPPLAAQERSTRLAHHGAVTIQSKPSAVDHADGRTKDFWSLLSQIVDDQNGAPSVDPQTLQPVPLLFNDNPVANPHGVYHIYKACWQVAHPGRLDPPGTAIKCYSSPATFELGDGSLASNPTGLPDTFFSGVTCPVTGPQQFSTADQAAAYWNAVRFYNASGQLIEGYRNEAYIGKFYNYTTGTSIPLWADYVVDYVEEPGPDGTQNNLQQGFYGNDFTVLAGNTLVLTPAWGNVVYSPGGSLVSELGPHPIDDYYNLGTTAPFVPVCTALE